MHAASKNKIRSAKDLKPEELNRLFTHGIHEEGVFYNRLNFFLVFESLLFAAAIAGFSGKDAPPAAIIAPLCIVGVVVSIVWWYAQVNKLVLLKTLEDRIKDAFDEFRETIWLADQRRIFPIWSANLILAHTFPPLFVVVWSYMLYYLLCRQ